MVFHSKLGSLLAYAMKRLVPYLLVVGLSSQLDLGEDFFLTMYYEVRCAMVGEVLGRLGGQV